MTQPTPTHRTLTEGQFRALRVARLLRTDPDVLEIIMEPQSDQLTAAIETYRRQVKTRQRKPESEAA